MDLLGATFVGVLVLAVLWKYSALPKIEWKQITSGALLFFAAELISVLALEVGILSGFQGSLIWVSEIVAIVAGLFVLWGIAANIIAQFK